MTFFWIFFSFHLHILVRTYTLASNWICILFFFFFLLFGYHIWNIHTQNKYNITINRPKYAIQAVKKKLQSQNPHTAYYALLVLESVVKNCGSPIHDEIGTRESCEAFSQLVEQTPHENVKAKMLELIQAWAFAFRSNDKYTAIKVSYCITTFF